MTAGRPPQHSERATIEIDSDSHEDEEEHSDVAGAQEAEVGPSGSTPAEPADETGAEPRRLLDQDDALRRAREIEALWGYKQGGARLAKAQATETTTPVTRMVVTIEGKDEAGAAAGSTRVDARPGREQAQRALPRGQLHEGAHAGTCVLGGLEDDQSALGRDDGCSRSTTGGVRRMETL